jgi:mRNA interferase RelE/StbE
VAEYRIVLARSAERELLSLPHNVEARVAVAIELLAQEPRPSGIKKLKGTADLWRIRVGDYRIVYRIDDRKREIDISHIRHRKDVYK